MLNPTSVQPKVLEILGENPSIPYSVIAGEVGVSRERVRQIARQNGYPRRRGIPKPQICPICGDTFYARRLYCSPVCRYRASRKIVFLNCHACGKSLERAPGNMRSKSGKYFCGKGCFRTWVRKSS
jgi:hypothetical protein